MAENYYSEILSEIRNLIEQGMLEQAYHRLIEEMRMPYIPSHVELELNELQKEVVSQLKLNDTTEHILSSEEIETYLKGSSMQQLKAVEALNSLNLRTQIPTIQSYLLSDGNKLAIALLIDSCIDQQIGEELKMIQEGLEIAFIPKFIEKAVESDGFNLAIELIKKWFENDDPSFLMMCTQVLIQEAYMKYPFVFDEDEGGILAYAVVRYVAKSMQDMKLWEGFVKRELVDEEKLFQLKSESV